MIDFAKTVLGGKCMPRKGKISPKRGLEEWISLSHLLITIVEQGPKYLLLNIVVLATIFANKYYQTEAFKNTFFCLDSYMI